MASPPKPQAAIDFLQRKQVVETEAWDDLKWGEHSHAFTVAHSAGAAVVNDIHSILSEAADTGQSFQETKRQLKALMAQKGWYGRTGIDPNSTGPENRKKSKQYINWRLNIIYEQNQLSAYSAGTTRRLWGLQDSYPYWQYKQRQRANKRETHAGYHNMILKAGDPAWGTITPPNGFRCACYRQPLTAEQASGQTIGLPANAPNIDPSFAYDPARESLAPNWAAYKKLKELGVLAQIKQNYRNSLAEAQMNKGEWQTYSQRLLTGQSGPNKNTPIHMATLDQQVLTALDFDPKLMATDKAITHGGRGRTKDGLPNPDRDLSLPQIAAMPSKLANPEHIFWDAQNRTWLFVYQLDGETEARVIFRQNGKRPLQLVSYTKVGSGNTQLTIGEAVYKK